LKAGNYQVKGGKVHRYSDGLRGKRIMHYDCGVVAYPSIGDALTEMPVTCKRCLRAGRT